MHASALSAEDFVWLLGSLCQLDRLPFDAQLILKGESPKPAILFKGDDERLVYFVAGSQTPETLPAAEVAARFGPAMLFVAHENAPSVFSEEGAAEHGFGFRWFARELLKHRRVWRHILAASLAIQLVGLATPLFTQVVIDKVVVHQTQSTLTVIAVGLAMFMLFSAGMSWLRQYLVLHTGNRVDAVMTGADVKSLANEYHQAPRPAPRRSAVERLAAQA